MSLPCDHIAGDALVPASRVAQAGAAIVDQARLLELLFGSLSLPKANSVRIHPAYRDANEKA